MINIPYAFNKRRYVNIKVINYLSDTQSNFLGLRFYWTVPANKKLRIFLVIQNISSSFKIDWLAML